MNPLKGLFVTIGEISCESSSKGVLLLKQLIINGDDFGVTQGVTTGIAFGHRFGVISSTCVMTNMPSRFLAASLSQARPELGVGVHLNLTCFRPLLPVSEVPSLVTENGWFRFDPRLSERSSISHVENELRAQIAEAYHLGFSVSHLDLHMGTTRLDILQLVVKLAVEHSLPIRRPRPGYLPGLDDWLASSPVRMPDYTEHFPEGPMTVDSLIAKLRSLPDGVTEIVTHPGYVSPEHQFVDDFWHRREDELSVLLNADVKAALEEENIELMSFHGLR